MPALHIQTPLIQPQSLSIPPDKPVWLKARCAAIHPLVVSD